MSRVWLFLLLAVLGLSDSIKAQPSRVIVEGGAAKCDLGKHFIRYPPSRGTDAVRNGWLRRFDTRSALLRTKDDDRIHRWNWCSTTGRPARVRRTRVPAPRRRVATSHCWYRRRLAHIGEVRA